MFACTVAHFGLHIRSILRCADNTGIVKAAIHAIGSNRHGTGKAGDVVRLAVRAKTPSFTGEMTPRGVVVRSKQPRQRKDGSVLKFDENAFVVISGNKPKGTKYRGPVPYEFQHSSRNLARWVI